MQSPEKREYSHEPAEYIGGFYQQIHLLGLQAGKLVPAHAFVTGRILQLSFTSTNFLQPFLYTYACQAVRGTSSVIKR